MSKKYEFTGETKNCLGITLHRIRAVRDIAALGIVAGTLGGWVQSEQNLSQVSGNAWVSGNAQVYGDAQVSGNAQVSGDAQVYGDAQVSGNAWVYGDAQVSGNAWVSGNAQVSGNAWVSGRNHLGWFSCVGSENGTLCWFLEEDGSVRVNRGCFSGSLDQFREAVEETHGENEHGQQYRLLIQFIELRSAEALRTFKPETEPETADAA